MKKLKNFIVTLFLLLLIVIGGLLIFNKKIEGWIVRNEGTTYQVSQIDKKQIQENHQVKASFDFDKVESMSSEAVLKAKLSNKKLPVIGGIAIPSVEINLPIFKGVSNDSLLWGAGTMSEAQVMGEGNYGLASHRAYEPELLFTPLEKVTLGEKIYLTDLSKVYEYTITFKEKVEPTKTELLDVQPNRKMVTLVTCGDMNATTRLVVQGELSNVSTMEGTPRNILQAFQLEQKTY